MKRERYMFGARGERYGIWNTAKKCWQFGICEDTPMLAEARLFQKIGDNARKWRFEARALPKEMRRAQPEPQLLIELQRKDVELKRLKCEMDRIKAELGAAISDLDSACTSLPTCAQCQYCKHNPCSDAMNAECDEFSKWEWRGLQIVVGDDG